jgi:hypothetical protein
MMWVFGREEKYIHDSPFDGTMLVETLDKGISMILTEQRIRLGTEDAFVILN